jgi:hypothetical protein
LKTCNADQLLELAYVTKRPSHMIPLQSTDAAAAAPVATAAPVLSQLVCILQLTDQVQRINGKLQASIATLGQTNSADGSTAAGISSGPGAAAARAVPSNSTHAKIATMSAEVVDSNPYSRLMALQRMGIVKDYERIRTKTVGNLQRAVLVHVACSRTRPSRLFMQQMQHGCTL